MKKKIYVCPKCGRALDFSDNPEYTFQCFDCDEDFYEFEAIEKEQPKLEGIKDYTDLVEASVEIGRIANNAIKESNKYINLQGKSIVEQIGEYIYETIKPIIEVKLHESSKFRDCAAIYHRSVHLKWYDNRHGICLCVGASCIDSPAVICFTENGYQVAEDIYSGTVLKLIENWNGFKDSMHRMIPYALSEYNEYRQKEVEKQKAKTDLIDNFKL